MALNKLVLNNSGFSAGIMSAGLSLFAVASAMFVLSASNQVEKAKDIGIRIKQGLAEMDDNCMDTFGGVDLDSGPLSANNFNFNGQPITDAFPEINSATVSEISRFTGSGASSHVINLNLNLDVKSGTRNVNKIMPLAIAANVDTNNVILGCKWMGGGETVATMCRAAGNDVYQAPSGATFCGVSAGMNAYTNEQIVARPEAFAAFSTGPMALMATVNAYAAENALITSQTIAAEMVTISNAIASSNLDNATKTAIAGAVGRITAKANNTAELNSIFQALTAVDMETVRGLASNHYLNQLAAPGVGTGFFTVNNLGAIQQYSPFSNMPSSVDPTSTTQQPNGLFSSPNARTVEDLLNHGAEFSSGATSSSRYNGGSTTLGNSGP